MSKPLSTPLDEAAFPRVGYETPTDDWVNGQQGMTLRDYFAAAALNSGRYPVNAYEAEAVATWCYAQADAMLKERQR